MMDKLLSKKGVTIIISLTVFLIATLMSMTIVNFAMDNAKRVARQKDQQQANLAVSSAAEYVRWLFNDITATCTDTKAPGATTAVRTWQFDYGSSGLGTLSDKFKNDFENLIKNKADGQSYEWKIVDDSSEITKALGVVIGVEKNKSSFVVTITKTNDSGTKGDYSMSFVYGASVFTDNYTTPVLDTDGNPTGTYNTIEETEYHWEYQSLGR